MKAIKYFFFAFLVFAILSLLIIQILQFINMGKLQEDIKIIQSDISILKEDGNVTPELTPTITDTLMPTDPEAQTMKVKLYYKNYSLDPDVIDCIADTYVERSIPFTTTPLTETIKLLLKNDLTVAEKALGLKSEFNTTPTSKNLSLVSASITNGTAKLTFNDPQSFTSGGSCRTGILASQIEKTAKQFSSVTDVEFLPELLFQP
jgi:hypothetical protein